jgi:hypothetical protein
MSRGRTLLLCAGVPLLCAGVPLVCSERPVDGRLVRREAQGIPQATAAVGWADESPPRPRTPDLRGGRATPLLHTRPQPFRGSPAPWCSFLQHSTSYNTRRAPEPRAGRYPSPGLSALPSNRPRGSGNGVRPPRPAITSAHSEHRTGSTVHPDREAC